MQRGLLGAIACLWLAAAMSGCGRRSSPTASPPQGEPKIQPPAIQSGEPAHEIEESTIRLADPEGRWTFEVQSERAEAAGIHGPYVLTPAEGRYDEKGREPVLMSADRGRVDEGARRVLLEGRVRVISGGWGLETDRLDYDLSTGKVVASGRTKWTFTESPTQAKTPEEGRGNEKTAGP